MVSSKVDCLIFGPAVRRAVLRKWARIAPTDTIDLLVPRVGFEPTTYRLRSGCSTAELPGRRDRRATAVAQQVGFLACYRVPAKPVRTVNSCETTLPQVSSTIERAWRGAADTRSWRDD
jgi:hypothetical protein